MKLLKITTIALAIATPMPALSQMVDQKIHKLCVEAKDYEGCVRAMTGRDSQQRVTVDQGKAETTGFNSCPAGYRYKGNGYCGEVVCKDAGMWFVGKHHPMLAGKDSWCKGSGLGSGGRLDFTGDTVRASFDPSCPDIELTPGWQNTCSQAKGPHQKGDGREPVNSNCTATICS
jgi:hypothetical protein